MLLIRDYPTTTLARRIESRFVHAEASARRIIAGDQ
jgi:hypothetical protein